MILLILSFLVDPSFTPYGIIATDERCSRICLLKGKQLEEIVSAPGCGRYYQLSPDRRFVGFKLLDENGLQTPALYDLKARKLIRLARPSLRCGQVHFANQKISYSIGKKVYLLSDGKIDSIDIGCYANLTPITNDGRFLIFNDSCDRIWMLEIESKKKVMISGSGYFDPIPSPTGRHIAYSKLSGAIEVYEIETGKRYDIGKGSHPSWSPDGKYLIYHVIETDNHQLIGSDLYLSSYDGKEKVRLTETPEIFEMDPDFIDQNRIIFRSHRGEIKIGFLINKVLGECKILYQSNQNPPIDYFQVKDQFVFRDSIDVPYLHQVYDVPDWFNGHWACAPTTAMMVIAFYNKLPYWDCLCSNPYQHISHYGRYICERYFYREKNYNLKAQDPNNNWAMGGYGYMWSGSNRPYTHMASYLTNHNIPSWRDDSPTFEEVINELNQGYPHSMCVGLTAAGHLVLAVGQVLNWHTLIFNDPYGNKNTPGYPSYDGKYARYDWPGYNNGYENLNYVYWSVYSHGDWEPPTDTIVDDLQFNDGFYLHTKEPSSMAYWWDSLSGYRGHLWWTYTTAAQSQDTCYATWRPKLDSAGRYEIYVYIPSLSNPARSARYQIHHHGGVDTVVIDQSQYPDQWVSLGIYPFADTTDYLYLGDATGSQGRHIAFDAAMWVYRGPGVEEGISSAGSNVALISSIVRNRIHLKFNLPQPDWISISLFSADGRKVRQIERLISAGGADISLDLSSLPSAIYFLHITTTTRSSRFKLIKI